MEKYFAIYKDSFNSIKTNWDTEKAWLVLFAFCDNDGLIWRRADHKVYEDKDEAVREARGIRFYDTQNRRYERYAYKVYTHKIWVHECDYKGRYIPTTGEIKKAVEFVKANKVGNENFQAFYDLMDKSPKEMRAVLIEKYNKM